MEDTTTPLIELDSVSHEFRDRTVLRDVTWSIGKNDFWSVLGPSGAGKTTLMKIAAGYQWPNSGGTVKLNGEVNRNRSEWWTTVGWLDEELKSKVPLQQSILHTVLSGLNSQTKFLTRKNEMEENIYEHAHELLDKLNGPNERDREFGTLSHGEKQAVMLARSLVSGPQLLVLDEPCAGMDPGEREFMLNTLRDYLLESESPACVYVTHNIEEILPECDYVLALKNGKITAKGDKRKKLNEELLSELYGVEVKLTRKNNRYWPSFTK